MPAHARLVRAAKQQGFSLMELMVVVAITGILAAVAIPTMTSYIMRSRTTEAVQFLGVIKLRQEAYRAEFGLYLVCGGVNQAENIAFVPGDATTMRNAVAVAWPANACFDAIGARPDGAVRFGYGWAANLPGNMSTAGKNAYGAAADDDHWFVAQAVTDMDADGIILTYEATSFTRQLWVGVSGGGPALSGWE